MGQYHGPYGFHAFSKLKPVLYQARWTTMKLMRPPYRRVADLLVRFLTR
jgi:coniferyl-aldehyde dehydrogenase